MLLSISDTYKRDQLIRYYIGNVKENNFPDDGVLKIADDFSNNLKIIDVVNLSGSNKKLTKILYEKVAKDDFLSIRDIKIKSKLIKELPKEMLIHIIKKYVKSEKPGSDVYKMSINNFFILAEEYEYDGDIIAELVNKVLSEEVNGQIEVENVYEGDIYQKIENDYDKFMKLSDDVIMVLLKKCNHKPSTSFIQILQHKKARESLLNTIMQYESLFNS